MRADLYIYNNNTRTFHLYTGEHAGGSSRHGEEIECPNTGG